MTLQLRRLGKQLHDLTAKGIRGNSNNWLPIAVQSAISACGSTSSCSGGCPTDNA
jgi:hypothetical protein